jgi:mRNA interferase MazF
VRGDIHRLRSDKQAKGREERGARFAVVLQADYLALSTVIVAPTSTSASRTEFRPRIHVDATPTLVLVEKAGSVDLSSIGEQVGRVTPAEQQEIDEALRDVFQL